MATVQIGFDEEMADKAILGVKDVTTRHDVKANLGDEFLIKDHTFKVVYLIHVTLGFVADDLYCREGFSSKETVHRALGYMLSRPSL